MTEQRETLQDVFRERFIETTEGPPGRRVINFVSGVDLDAELFVLEPTELDTETNGR